MIADNKMYLTIILLCICIYIYIFYWAFCMIQLKLNTIKYIDFIYNNIR